MPGGASQLFDPDEVAAPEDRRGVHSIGGVYDQVERALDQAFPRKRHLWVRGEIQHVSDHRSGHLYMSLVDPEDDGARRDRGRGGVPTLNVKCWRSSWAPLRHGLAKEGIELAEGMVVVLRGSLDLYRAKGEISLILAEIDVTALLGRLAAQRAKLLRTLEAEGLLRRNAARPMPEVPLHVGLVASPGTEGCRDFLGQLTGSGFGFRISHVPVSVQGPGAPASIARALTVLSRSDCEVIAVVRGGGARADLAAFETEVVARAVAVSAKPVFTGIGHTGDETVADIVAARVCITPTECGQEIVTATRRWWAAHVAEPAGLLSRTRPGLPPRRPVPRHPGPWSPHGGGPSAAPGAPGAPVHQGVGHRPGGTGPARVVRGAGPRPRHPAGAAQSGPPRAPGRAPAVVAQAAGRLRRGPAARTGLQPDGHARRTPGAQRGRIGRAAGDRDPVRGRYGAEPSRGDRGWRPHVTDPDESVPVEQLSFTDASRELDAIVHFFEQREVDVDVLVGRLERATALIDELDRRLRRTQAQVEELVPRLDALAGADETGADGTGADERGEDDA